jgi:hypothetical protein
MLVLSEKDILTTLPSSILLGRFAPEMEIKSPPLGFNPEDGEAAEVVKATVA